MKQQRGVILTTLKLELKGGREMIENKKTPQDVRDQEELKRISIQKSKTNFYLEGIFIMIAIRLLHDAIFFIRSLIGR